MDAYEAIYSRRTIRDFKERGVIDTGIVKKILDAGLHAPSNNHMRQWEFVIVNDMPTRLKLIEKVEKCYTEKEVSDILEGWKLINPCQREMYFDAIPKQYAMLLKCSCLIIPCFQQKFALLQPDTLSSLNGFASIWCCVENILIAAAAEGIYGVTRIPFVEEIKHIKEIINCPEDYEIPCYIALGYPAENLKQIQQLPIKVEDKLHFNKW